jgi:hypothetical protein
MKYIKVTEVDNTGIQKYCGKCGKPHYLLKYDGQVMQMGNVQIFNSIRYSCICGFAATFYPLPLEDDTKSLGESSRKVLIKLGKKSKGDNKQDEF